MQKPDEAVYQKIQNNWDALAKPLEGLGVFEELIARIGAIRGDEDVKLERRCLLVFCGDNGIVAEGVSQCGSPVTAKVARLLGQGKSTACVMAAAGGVDVIPVNVGIDTEEDLPGVRNCRVAKGTKNFLHAPAMTREECEGALQVGMDLARECAEKGYDAMAVGEMGIGNTTTAAAVGAILLGLSAPDVVGRGAGLSDEGLRKKEAVVAEAIARYGGKDPFEVLRSCGGLEIAAMAGAFIGAASCGLPAVVDGAVSAVAALVAERLAPGAVEFMIPSHIGREGICGEVLGNLGLWLLTPINGDLALGEGTGAIMLFPLLDTALALYHTGIHFREAGIDSYQHYPPGGVR